MTEFTQAMRKWTAGVLPEMSGRLYKAPEEAPHDPSGADQGRSQEDTIVGGWFADVVRGAEAEREEIIRARGLRGQGA